MNTQHTPIEELIEAHLAGQAVNVPQALEEDFAQALGAHRALRGMLDETLPEGPLCAPREAPTVPDQYQIECELGRGGMGVVYLARQRSLNRRVALKVLRPGEQILGALTQRFLDEAQHLARLRHPHIVAVHEVGDANGEPYFTMDYIEGESLAALLARGPLPPTRAVEILKQAAAAIGHAHRQGIIHRDLKPANVLLDRAGQVFVTDFGLARDLSQDSHLTKSGELLGTPQYMSPEQARGQAALVGEATDIHALGLLLFEMLAGRPAFGALSPADVLVKLLHEEPAALRSLDRRIPRDLETICQKALQKSPAARYANVSALLEDVRRYEAGEPLVARRTSNLARAARWCYKRWRVAAAALASAAFVLVLMLVLAPRLFDQSVEDLVAWGDEELSAGRADVAAKVFERAFAKCEPARRREIAERLTESIRQMPDSKPALELALNVVESSPQASFGKHDFLVAQALAAKARAETKTGFFEPAHENVPPRELAGRELAARRLAIFLDGPFGTPAERAEAERTLQAIERSLRGLRPAKRWSGDEFVQLPEDAPAGLQRRAADNSLNSWERGKARLAQARIHEAAGESGAALAAYRASLEQLRVVYPFASGVVSESQFSATGRHPLGVDAPESRLLREVLDSLRSLDAAEQPVVGSVRVRVDQPELLSGVSFAVRLTLCDEAIADPHRGLGRNLSSSVPLPSSGTAELRVLAGKYRLSFGGTSMKWIPVGDIDTRLLDISAEQWPQTVEIGADSIDLPPLTVRKLSELSLIEPADLERVDLRSTTLAWQEIEGADYYEVTLAHFRDAPVPGVTYFQTLRTKRPSLSIGGISGRERETVQRNWLSGRVGGYRVQAFDAAGRRLAISLDDRRFLIAAPLAAE